MSVMERTRSPQSRHRKRRLLEATQHVSPVAERQLVETWAAQVSVDQNSDPEAVNSCVRVLRNVKNSVYLRAMAARALGLLMLQSRTLADRLRLETEGLVDALLQLVGYCRRCRTQTADVRRVHVNCCLVISLLMQAPSHQQHLQLVVSLDSELLVLQPQPSDRESGTLLLTVAGRPESGRLVTDDDDGMFGMDNIQHLSDGKKKMKTKRRQINGSSSPPRGAKSTNQQSPSHQERRKVAWSENEGVTEQRVGVALAGLRPPPENNNDRLPISRFSTETLAASVARRETPNRLFKMDRHRLVIPAFPRQYIQDPPLCPLPLIQPTGGYHKPREEMISEEGEGEDDIQDAKQANAFQPHSASDTLLHPKHMLEIFRTGRMPLSSAAYFQQHLRDDDVDRKNERRLSPSRLQVTQWDQWNQRHKYDEDESERDAMTAVTAVPRGLPQPVNIDHIGKKSVNTTARLTSNGQRSPPKLPPEEVTTPEFKHQRLREILSSPEEPNEESVRQLRTLAHRVNTSVMTSLGSKFSRVRNEENLARQEMHSMIQQERERLPLKFLFQLPGGAAYCRHRLRRAMSLWILEFEDNQRRMALMQWKAVVEHARFRERGEEYHRQAIKKRLKVAIEYVLRGYQQQGLRKWIETTQMLIWCDRDAGARLIQAQFRRHLGREYFLALHRHHPFASPVLRDIYLAPARPNILFRLPNEFREHRRKIWRAAEHVQRAYRYRRFRIALARYRVAATKIQAFQRMRSARSRYHHARRQIILIQARVRMRFCREAFVTLRNAALLVQSVYRSVRMRRLRRLVLCAQRKEHERMLSSIALLQRIARGFLGRIATRELRLLRNQEWHAALVFQRCWYKRNNEWSTFLLLGCLREKGNEECAFNAQVLAFKRNHMARLIRRRWFGYLSAKHNNAAALIQRNVRRHAAQLIVQRMRLENIAHRRIKWFFRAHHAHRIRTATYLQFWWLKAVPGRLRHYLFVRRIKAELEDKRYKYMLEDHASCQMQALVRGHIGRKIALRERSARSIQRTMRVHLMRKHFREEMARVRTLVSHQTTDECIDTAVHNVVNSTMNLYNASATKIQRISRGCRCRMRVMRNIVHAELRTRMAIRIQRTWRQNVHQRTARKLLQAQKRKQTNLFRDENSMSAIIDKMTSLSAEFYDPSDELRGMSVQEWLRRLGVSATYSEVFQKNRWIASVDPLAVLKRFRELDHNACEEKLENIGVHKSEDIQMMLTNLFAYQTIQETKRQRQVLSLAREQQTQLQRKCDFAQKHLQACIDAQQKCEDVLDEVLQDAKDFRNPPKAVREKQAIRIRELEDAVRKTSDARTAYDSSTELHANHAREINTQQKLFTSRQEPKEISAVHSLRSLKLIDQLNIAREIFLERFPGLDARALAFVSNFEENQVTRWQLQRFFDSHTSTSEIKLNMKELTFFAFETEVKKQNHSRFGQCADILQYGHERLAELLGISVEMVALGVENANAKGDGQRIAAECRLVERILLGTMTKSRNSRGNQEKARVWRMGADLIAKMNTAAIKMQSLWRGRAGKKLVARLRSNQHHHDLREQYLAEFHTDHVTPFWQSERKKEQEALDAWLEEEAKAHRMRLLYNILRYPYVEEWDDETQTYVYAIYSRQVDDPVPPLDDDQQQFEQAPIRYVVAEKPTYTVEEEDRVIRIQAQTRRFLAQCHLQELQRLYRRERRRAALETEWNSTRNERTQLLTLKFQFQFRKNSHVNTWLNARVNTKTPVRSQARVSISVSSPTKPTKRDTSPKKALGPGRDKSPTKGVSGTQKGDDDNIVEKDATQKQRRSRMHTTLDAVVDALVPTYNTSVRTEHRRNWSFPANSRPGNAHGRAIIHYLEQLPVLYSQVLPESYASTTLRYTKMALRFGWEEVQAANAPRSYFFNKNTYATSWERPDYSFDEQYAAIQIQALARTLLAIKTREVELASISFVATVQDTIKQAERVGWVGYSLEGMTSAVFLSRFGLTKHITSLGKVPLKELLITLSSEQDAKKLGWSNEEAGLVPLFPRTRVRRFPQSCTRETSVLAGAKHPFNILPTERVTSQLVTQRFPNQQGRVAGLIRALRVSTTPISYRQLEMHLRRYAGRPDDAIANVSEITSLAIATREPQEKSIFVLYRCCVERCVVYAANLKLSTLRRELSAVLRILGRLLPPSTLSSSSSDAGENENIMGTAATAATIPVVPISSEEEERLLKQTLSRYPRCTVKGLWENEVTTSFSYAQMALYLREEALERVLAWERTALLCQTNFRMLRMRRWYVATQKTRSEAAITIQCAWRSLGARELCALLESQQQSPYEQRLDKRTDTFYFVYVPTDEKLLDEPRDEVTGGILPFRPMIQDRLTKRWMLAWPNYKPASRRARTPMSGRSVGTPWVACSICTAERAARRCNECYSSVGDYVDFCLACFYDGHFPTSAAIGSDDISWHTYTSLNPLSTPFFRCVECSRPSILRCLPCNEHYCERCFTRVHARGKTRSRHAREWYAAHAVPCVECEMRVACQRCLTCQDALCEMCMTRTHARGRRADGKTHMMELLPQPLEPGEAYCEQCNARRGDERCEFCSQTLCAVCHWSSSSPSGVHSSQHALVCVETALAEKRRELLGNRGLCVECGKAADRECTTCGDRYCSVRWMGNPGCFERFHSKGKRSDHTFTMVDVQTEMPPEILALEEKIRVKRRRDAEMAEHEAKRLTAALLEEEIAAAKKNATKTRQKKTKKSKSKKRLTADAPDGRKPCGVPQCRRRALVLDISGVSLCPDHFTLQYALEVSGKDPLEAARLLALVENGGGRVVKKKKPRWSGLLPSTFFSRSHREGSDTSAKAKETSTSNQAESSITTVT